MSAGRGARALAAIAVAATALGCGLGAGPESEGEALLSVTRDYGSRLIAEAARSDPPASETVLRLLDRETDIETRYGGGFVQSIEGLAGAAGDDRRHDWFFYVNGVESPVGAADVPVRAGDRIWWDYRDWTTAMRVPAVVGQWPEPFAQASAGEARAPVAVDCAAERRVCEEVAARVEAAGAEAVAVGRGDAAGGDPPGPRLLVGAWASIRDDWAASLLERGPAHSGVFGLIGREGGGWRLSALDERGRTASVFGPGSGLVAALREGDEPPTWLVTGTDGAGVELAADALDAAALRGRYALVAAPAGQGTALPVVESEAP